MRRKSVPAFLRSLDGSLRSPSRNWIPPVHLASSEAEILGISVLPAYHAGGRRFEPRRSRQSFSTFLAFPIIWRDVTRYGPATPCASNRNYMPQILRSNCSRYFGSWPLGSKGIVRVASRDSLDLRPPQLNGRMGNDSPTFPLCRGA
jgi:hypothetical protein